MFIDYDTFIASVATGVPTRSGAGPYNGPFAARSRTAAGAVTKARRDMEDSDRRGHLRELDDILDALEQLNLKDARALPEGVRAKLEKVGIKLEPGDDVTGLIEKVWIQQEQFLSGSAQGAEVPGQLPRRRGL